MAARVSGSKEMTEPGDQEWNVRMAGWLAVSAAQGAGLVSGPAMQSNLHICREADGEGDAVIEW
jgi:hypothetical protein